MKLPIVIFLVLIINFSGISQQVYAKKEPFAHTYSIVARDTVTGEMGVAVQSHWFSVGSLVLSIFLSNCNTCIVLIL